MKYIVFLFIILYSYAAIRYHIGKGMGVEYFALILNKAIAWAAATYLGLSILKLKPPFPSKKTFGIGSFILGLIHITFTFLLTCNGFFPNYVNDQCISEEGLLVLISGGLTIIVMIFPLLASLFPTKFPRPWIKLGKFALCINILHPAIIGTKNWSALGDWPLFLPPITLLATLIYAYVLLVHRKQKRVL
jgi:hypothetical protein